VSHPDFLRSIVNGVANGSITPDAALEKLKNFDWEPVADFAKIDRHRHLRTGFPEVIWGIGKTPEQIAQIFQTMRVNHPVVMATRIERETYQILRSSIRDLQYYPSARICAIVPSEISVIHPGKIGVITAGTADLPVAEEAVVTATLFGFQVERIADIGVAGIHRLLDSLPHLETMDVLIVVAGMEGALPTVIAGVVDRPVIAVPTSIGYGASFGGVAPLLTMLNSCAAGVGVVNIDNGFGAAMLAGKILLTASRMNG
jgi:NCAIR mutase (PurE)-related protein